MSSLGADESKPFSSVRDGEVLHIMYPSAVHKGDLLAGLITVLAAILPTVVLQQTDSAWNEPEWSPESRRHLAGMITGIRSIPDSFSHTTSPTDLVRISMWLTAASSALSVPGGVADAQGVVLPSSVGGAKSASKYMLRVFQGLRASITDEKMVDSLTTLSSLLKLWQKEKHKDALSIVRKCKIAWSAVLFKGATTAVIKGKRGKPDQTVLRSPPKPSRSPWLSSVERTGIGELFKSQWSGLDEIRKRWNALIAEQQHRQYNTFIREIQKLYEDMHRISSSVHAKLGKRKHWIDTVCKKDGFAPKAKKSEAQSFLLSAHFFKKENLHTLHPSVQKVFSPAVYLEGIIQGQDAIYKDLYPSEPGGVYRWTKGDFNEHDHSEAFRMWGIWADTFKPVFRHNVPVVQEAKPDQHKNPFLVPGAFPEEVKL